MSDRQKSPLIAAWKNRLAIENIGEMVAKMLKFDALEQTSKDEGVKKLTATFHVANEPKPGASR